MFTLLDVLLRRVVRHGDLTVTDAAGVAHRYGDGSGPAVALRLTDHKIERRLVRDPQLALGRSLHGRPAGDASRAASTTCSSWC